MLIDFCILCFSCLHESSTISNSLWQKWSQQATESNTSTSEDQSTKRQSTKSALGFPNPIDFLGLLGKKNNILQIILFRVPQKKQNHTGLE